MKYAQINAAGVCYAESFLHSEIESADLVPIADDFDALGKTWDGEQWHDPAPAPEPAQDRRVTRLAFLSRFTDHEAIAIDLASIGATVQAASMRRYLAKVNAANFVDLAREDTRAGVQALEAASLLASGRAAAILDAPIAPHERPPA